MISERQKVIAIIKHFKFKDMDDATERLSDVILHYKQERKEIHESDCNVKSNKVVDEIYDRLQKPEYKKPLFHCHHFVYLLEKIGKKFHHKGIHIWCHPNYIKEEQHWVFYDNKSKTYRDPSVYKSYFDFENKKWVGKPYPFRCNVPKSELNLIKRNLFMFRLSKIRYD